MANVDTLEAQVREALKRWPNVGPEIDSLLARIRLVEAEAEMADELREQLQYHIRALHRAQFPHVKPTAAEAMSDEVVARYDALHAKPEVTT